MNYNQYPLNGMMDCTQPGMGMPCGTPMGPFGMIDPMGVYPQQSGGHTTKKEIVEFIQAYTGSINVEQVDSFETQRARHICSGTSIIKILDKSVIEVPLKQGGSILVETFICPMCRKVLVNRESLEFC